MNKDITIVTGLWDMGRDKLTGAFPRTLDHYLRHFHELLKIDMPMHLFLPASLKDEALSFRDGKPTTVTIKELDEFKTWFPFFDQVQKIRQDSAWLARAGWLPGSPQAALEYYNPVLMSKMFMVHDASIMNRLGSRYFFWLDAGITNTVGSSLLTVDNALEVLDRWCEEEGDSKLAFISYPYQSDSEVHGFEAKKFAEYCGVPKTEYVCRGGFFGGRADHIHALNGMYYDVLHKTMDEGLMGADECIFTILNHRNPGMVRRFELKPENNGLCGVFFENLKRLRATPVSKTQRPPLSACPQMLYLLAYNYPKQLAMVLESFEKVDRDFLDKPRKILINNSTDRTTDEEYQRLAKQYGLEMIMKDNIGICGGRQFAAEHFEESGAAYMIFFEDDMLLTPRDGTWCKMGFRRHVDRLYERSLRAAHELGCDFLKLSFSEFFGDNATQWAWTNLPAVAREKFFPGFPAPSGSSVERLAPRVKFDAVRHLDDLSFAEGQIFYANWPAWFSKEGSRKVFLTERWQHPHEQTWMSYAFQEMMAGKIRAAVLLASPITHNRVCHYSKEARKES